MDTRYILRFTECGPWIHNSGRSAGNAHTQNLFQIRTSATGIVSIEPPPPITPRDMPINREAI
ncbi:hypothetical protein [Pseudobacter ginsenosidimutans]|uniref:hypothetical protein n=1 Tax=Pseudobacter ginsenosidimutans TaxID=661488 RepID=UPI0013EF1053|nr:hypothetical protein [Pseudobacter ginsenosidimutans]